MKNKIFYSLALVLFSILIIGNSELSAKKIMYSYIIDYSLIGCEVSDIRFEKDTIDAPDLSVYLKKVNWHFMLPEKMKSDNGSSFSICDSSGQDSPKMIFNKGNSLEHGTPEALMIYCRYYNEKGFIERYTYSNCIICSNMPFDARYSYDSKDRIIRIANIMPIDNNKIEIDYFSNGTVRRINVFDSNSKITKTVIFKYEDLK